MTHLKQLQTVAPHVAMQSFYETLLGAENGQNTQEAARLPAMSSARKLLPVPGKP